MFKQKIIKMDVDVTNLDSALQQVEILATKKQGAYVCVSNVHMCIEALDSNEFEQVVNKADLVIPDGKPLSWAQKFLGHKAAQQVRGQDIMNALCAASGEQKLNIGFYGGSSGELLSLVKSKLTQTYPDIRISYAYSPPFRPLTSEEDGQVVKDINNAKVNVLFVGIGCPKQERWMAEHKDKLNCVMLGVGAAYDFIAGSKKHAPRWVQKIGMEWLFRLCSEPKRLWRRYLSTNPRFIWHFGKQYFKYLIK
ncbi:WecB/TagA/CpsF family glycosyltransferase [Pseudoalteromonas marina]|uniref:WecB/TagA/CpsF family glycosyltransferase n=1 Tax=Pseudoalteromonas marina TaxID=267375 RepID=UPI00273279EF|nr:WecB/TagA/CpsF family glycosyltransferase [Pseudoalteromonas marina]MDP2485786.1 WecB/TagA/CpsF family glycosyltransferase [Pseudoalteromonas marina]